MRISSETTGELIFSARIRVKQVLEHLGCLLNASTQWVYMRLYVSSNAPQRSHRSQIVSQEYQLAWPSSLRAALHHRQRVGEACDRFRRSYRRVRSTSDVRTGCEEAVFLEREQCV